MMPYITIFILTASLLFNNINHPKAILALGAGTLLLLISKILYKNSLHFKLNIIILLLIISNIISLIFSSTGNLGLTAITAEVTILTFFSLLLSKEITNKQQFKILIAITTLCILESIFGVSQFIFREENRIAGTFMSYTQKANYFPNAFALFLILTWPFSLLLKNTKYKYFALSISILAILLTFSRGGYIVVFIQNILLFIYYFKNKNYQVFKIMGISFLISILALISLNELRTQKNLTAQDINQKITFNSTEKITSYNERKEFFINTPKLIMQKPIFGYGPESFSYVYPQVQPRFIANAPHPHNIFIKIIVEKGSINFLIFTTLLLFAGFLTIKNIDQIKKEDNFLILTAIVGGILHNQIDYNFNFVSNYFIFFTLLALLLNNLIFNKKNNQFNKKLNLNIKHSLILLTILISLSSYWIFNEIKLKTAYKIAPTNKTTAINILSNTNYLDSNRFLADLYLSSNQYQEAITTLKKQISINPYDAFAFNKLGSIYETMQNSKESSNYFKKALQTDPMNHWEFYYNYYNINRKMLKSNRAKIIDLLQNYLFQAENNIHFTSQTPNIDFAIKTSELLNENKITNKLKEIKQYYKTSN